MIAPSEPTRVWTHLRCRQTLLRVWGILLLMGGLLPLETPLQPKLMAQSGSSTPSEGTPSSLTPELPEDLKSGPQGTLPEGLPTELPAEVPTELPPGVSLDALPQAPKPPTLPGPLGDMLNSAQDSASGNASSPTAGGPFPPGTRTRLEIDHRKRAVLLPRLGLLYTAQPRTLPADNPNSQTLPAVMQSSLGVEFQKGIRRTWYATAELQGLYILSGGYGLGDGGSPDLLRFGEGSLTVLTGLGVGRFTSFLDAYSLWSRAALKVGYLYPYYGLTWLNADVSRELRRTPQNYWEITASPSIGMMVPLDARGAEIFQRLGLLAGLQLSVAFIFAPLGG